MGQIGQVHRFHDHAAIFSGSGETRYMTADDAEGLAKALLAIVASIRAEHFKDSAGLTAEFETMSSTYGMARVERDEHGRTADWKPDPLFFVGYMDADSGDGDGQESYYGYFSDVASARIAYEALRRSMSQPWLLTNARICQQVYAIPDVQPPARIQSSYAKSDGARSEWCEPEGDQIYSNKGTLEKMKARIAELRDEFTGRTIADETFRIVDADGNEIDEA